MNTLLEHWKIDQNSLKKIKLKNLGVPENISAMAKIEAEGMPEWMKGDDIICYITAAAAKSSYADVSLDISGKKYPLITAGNKTLELNNIDGIINAVLDEVYYPKKRPSFSYFPFPYTKIPVFIRLGLFKLLLKFKHDPGWPKWPIEKSIDAIRHLFMMGIAKACNHPVKYIDFWPKGRFALLLTHDCDSEASYRWIEYIREMEKSHGFTSSWNFVPKKYELDFTKIRLLKKEGCEIGIHDYDHTANLPYRSREEIAGAIDYGIKQLKEFNPNGFRSAQLQRTPEFMSILADKMAYDSSVPDTDIYSPVYFRNGACTIFPFFIKKMVELPLTLQQDFRLKRMGMSPVQIAEAWKLKLKYIHERGGLATMNVHPDDFIFGSEYYLKAYEDFLKHAEKLEPWNANPSDIAKWWHERCNASLKGGKVKGSKRARVAEFTEKI
ncbi:MAG TPA: hypothetical protein HA362_04620 [Nanoarchaeota archaeon]|nr:hypothetical protein [Nanoarchaeota archaeon]